MHTKQILYVNNF